MYLSTFSIVALDPATRQWGVAVQSKFLAAAAVVLWARAEVGAVATQAWANVGFGPEGLELLGRGMSAHHVVETLVAGDEGASRRQLGVVDARGRAAAFTGDDCMEWAGHVTGDGYTCQGNVLAGPEVVRAMAASFEASEGALADRMVAALAAGQTAGGDRRGQQSAGLFVVKEGGSYGGYLDRYIDLRVDDHPAPIDELGRLLTLFYLHFERPDPESLLPLEGEVEREVGRHLETLGFDPARGLEGALESWVGHENLEERMTRAGFIDPVVLDYLRRQAVGEDG